MPKLELSEKQLRLISQALDFYARVGIGQMWAINDHPTFEKILEEKLRPSKVLEVGDSTERGEIKEICENMVTTEGNWGNGKELRKHPAEEVKLSIDYEKFHSIRDRAEEVLNIARNILICEELNNKASYGIHNPKVDESCREAWDLVQIIRHEFWKANPNRSDMTVDSSVSFSSSNTEPVKISL
jgi:hypothetical protein